MWAEFRFFLSLPFSHVIVGDVGGYGKLDGAGYEVDGVHGETERDGDGEERADHVSELLRRRGEAEDAAFEIGRAVFGESGIHGRIRPDVETADGKLKSGKSQNRLRKRLERHQCAADGKRNRHGEKIAVPLAEFPPKRGRRGSGDAAQGQNHAARHLNIFERPQEFADVERRNGADHHDAGLECQIIEQKAANVPVSVSVTQIVGDGALLFFRFCFFILYETPHGERDEPENGGADEEGVAHAEHFRHETAHNRPHDAADDERRLRKSERRAQIVFRDALRQNGERGRDESVRESLKRTRAEKLPFILDEAAKEIGNADENPRTHDHFLFSARIGEFPPHRAHDAGDEKAHGKNHAVPKFHIISRDAELNQVQRQKRNQHGVSGGNEKHTAD